MTTQRVYRAIETPVTFKDSGGDVVITLQNLAFGAGRVSARKDRGAGAQPRQYEVRAVVQFETAPIVGEVVDVYIFESDGTFANGTVGTADAALTAAKLKNGNYIGSIYVETTSTATDIVASFITDINSRYYSVGVWNWSAGDNLKNTANVSCVIVTPVPDDIQAAA